MSSLPLQALPGRQDPFDLQLPDGDSTIIDDAIHVNTGDNGQPLVVSTSETLLGRYKSIIKDAISSLSNDSGLPNPSPSPGGIASASSRPRWKRTISHLGPGSGRPRLQVLPAQGESTSILNSIVHARFDNGPDLRGSDLSLSPGEPVRRQNAIPQADFLAQPGFLEAGYSGVGSMQIEDERYHHINMSAFDVDISDFLGNWGIEEP